LNEVQTVGQSTKRSSNIEAELELAKIRLAKAKVEAIENVHSTTQKDLDRYQSAINDAQARLAAKSFNKQSAVQPVPDKFHVADRSGTYDLGKGRTLRIGASSIDEQWFEICWPANGEWKKSRLRIPVSISAAEAATLRMLPITRIEYAPQDADKGDDQAQGRGLVVVEPTITWKIFWKENTDDVWFEQSQEAGFVTHLNTANSAQVTATHYYRGNDAVDSDIPIQIRHQHRQMAFRSKVEIRVWPPVKNSVSPIGANAVSPQSDQIKVVEYQLKLAAESSGDWNVIASKTDADGKPSGTVALPVKRYVRSVFHNGKVVESPIARVIRGTLLNPDGTPAVGYFVYAENGVNRRNHPTPEDKDLPEPATTNEDGSFEIVLDWMKPSSYSLWAAKEHLKISEDFAPLEVTVPANGDVGQIRFSNGRVVTGKVVGLDGKGLANVQVWSTRQNPRVQGLYPLICNRLATTGDDGAFTLPPLAAGKHLLKIGTSSLGDDELSVAFANQLVDVPDSEPLRLDGLTVNGNLQLAEENHDPIEVDFRPLKTVNITLDVSVNRSNPKFSDFEVRISGRLPGINSANPASFWIRQGTTTLAQGHFTIPVPEGLTHASIRAAPVYMRTGDKPEFIWHRPNDPTPKKIDQLELGTVSAQLGLALTVRDAPVD